MNRAWGFWRWPIRAFWAAIDRADAKLASMLGGDDE